LRQWDLVVEFFQAGALDAHHGRSQDGHSPIAWSSLGERPLRWVSHLYGTSLDDLDLRLDPVRLDLLRRD
jgi:hypothetical protein